MVRKVATTLTSVVGMALLGSCAATADARTDSFRIAFDYAAAETIIAALQRPTLSQADARALLDHRGITAMVDNIALYVPGHTREDFVTYVGHLVREGTAPRSAFNLATVRSGSSEVAALLATLRANEPVIQQRMISRVQRYAPVTGPVEIKVYFVVGGVSDGFAFDDDPEPAFFVALDKASADVAGLEQNMTHELYHVLQKVSALRVPPASRFMASLDRQPPVQQLLAMTLREGSANFAADPRDIEEEGPYIEMWRDRYIRNLAPDQTRANFALFDSLLADLAAGVLDWQTANYRGFSGSEDARLYFVGMEMIRALVEAHGASYIDDLFIRSPVQFFRDYFSLSDQRPSLPRFSGATVETIAKVPAAW
jgi:hypothetical protein